MQFCFLWFRRRPRQFPPVPLQSGTWHPECAAEIKNNIHKGNAAHDENFKNATRDENNLQSDQGRKRVGLIVLHSCSLRYACGATGNFHRMYYVTTVSYGKLEYREQVVSAGVSGAVQEGLMESGLGSAGSCSEWKHCLVLKKAIFGRMPCLYNVQLRRWWTGMSRVTPLFGSANIEL